MMKSITRSLLILAIALTHISVHAETPATTPAANVHEVMIPMPDGVHLAADLFTPVDMKAGENYPVLLEYIPYRKDDARSRNIGLYSYFTQHGYIVARVDIRGTGNSEGRVIPYEYSDIELDDGEVVIDWLAKQKWSTGNVGMFGISWSGFNSIQMAVRKPPAFKAYVSLMSTEDLYQEDVHYMDGIMHTDSWMMSADLYNSMPGAPEYRLDEDWLENRFNVKPSVYTYMHQQREGPFWDRASSLDKYDQIKVPGFFIGGWYDGYRDSVPRMLENIKNAPVKAIIGPWDHTFPNTSWPKPSMEWRHEAVRWFDHWLKGIDTGILDEPKFAVYVRDWHKPGPGVDFIPGHWRWEEGWPIDRIKTQSFFADAENGLSPRPTKTATHELTYKASVGLAGGGPVMWWGSMPPDQQSMDDHSLVYDSEPLESPLEILGLPKAMLNVSADATRANWVVRISDVSPDGTVTQVGGAAFNGTHRNSARDPEDLVPNEVFPLEIEMHFTSWVFPEGHKIRFAVSNSMWPMLWPTPYPTTTTLAIGGTEGARLLLPVVPGEKRPVINFKPPAENPTLPGYAVVPTEGNSGYAEIYSIERDPKTGEAFGAASSSSKYRYPWGLESYTERIEHRTNDLNPAKTSVTGIYSYMVDLEDRTIRMEQEVEFFSVDDKNFRMIFARRFKLNGKVIHEKKWDELIPRDHQ